MSTLAIGPLLALLGIISVFVVLRGRSRSRKSLYRTLRDDRERDLKRLRTRAADARAAQARAELEQREAAAAAAAAAAAPAPLAPSPLPPGPVVPTRAAAATSTPPFEPTVSAPLDPPAERPAWDPAPPADVPTKPPAAIPDRAAWEITPPAADVPVVTPVPEAPMVEERVPVAAGQPDWLASSTGASAVDQLRRSREGKRGRGQPAPIPDKGAEEDEEDVRESAAQVALSYAGLVAALLMVLVGVVVMIGMRR